MAQSKKENIKTWSSQIQNDYRIAISVDCVIFGYDGRELKVVLIKCDMPQYEGQYSLVGDLVRPDQTLDESAKRILNDRIGLGNLYQEQVHAFSIVERHPLGRVISVAYYSLVNIDDCVFKETGHQDEIKWVTAHNPGNLAFDHNEILDKCLQKLQYKVRKSAVGFNLLPEKFTIQQLQDLYQAILLEDIDKRNFRRKIKKLDVLKDIEERQSEVSHRPAKIFSFDRAKFELQELKGSFFDSTKKRNDQ